MSGRGESSSQEACREAVEKRASTPARNRTPVLVAAALVIGCETNGPPVASDIPDQTVHVGNAVEVGHEAHFSDPDGDPLTYEVSTDNGDVDASIATGRVVIRGVSVGESRVTVAATDPGGESAMAHFVATVPNRAPTLAAEPPDLTIAAGTYLEQDLQELFVDPDGEALVYAGESADDEVAVLSVRSGTSIATLQAVLPGQTTGVVSAVDPHGEAISGSFDITVPNRPPVLDQEIPDTTMWPGASLAIDLTEHFSEPDGQTLTYTARSADPRLVETTVTDHTLTLASSADSGHTGVIVSASDGALSVADTFDVTVEVPEPWRENFDSAGSLKAWRKYVRGGGSVGWDDDGALSAKPASGWTWRSTGYRDTIVDIDRNWSAATRFRQTEDASCSYLIVSTGDSEIIYWRMQLSHVYFSLSAVFTEITSAGVWVTTLSKAIRDAVREKEWVDIGMSLVGDTMTVTASANDAEEKHSFVPEVPDYDYYPRSARGLGVGSRDCYMEDKVESVFDWVEIKYGR